MNVQVQVEKLEHNMAKLTVEVPYEEFEQDLQKAYNKNKNRINLAGFRKGKVPRQIIEKMYGKDFFFNDGLNSLLPRAYAAAKEECGEDIVSRPKVDVTQVEVDKPVIFTAEVALNPEVTLKEYKGVEIEKIETEVTDEEVEETINKEREDQARVVSVERAAQMGDIAVLDYEGFIDGEAFDGGKGTNYSLTLGSGSFIPGFEEQVAGKNIEEDFEVNVTFPEDYHAEEMAGKAAVFKCRIHEVKEKQIPELDDDFADDAGFETVDEYKADIRKRLEERKTKEAKQKKESAVIDKILETAEMDIPEAMIRTEVEDSMDQYEQRLRMQGLSLDQYFKYTGLNRETMMEQSRPQIESGIRSRLVLEAVAKAEGIEATDEEYEKELEEIAASYKTEVDRVRDLFKGREEKAVRKDIAIRKAVDFIVENAVEK